MVKVGLVGFGSFGRKIYQALTNLSAVEVVFITKQSHDQNTIEISQKNSLNLIQTTQLKQALPCIDWAIVATPNATHYKIVKQCLNQNKNVFCEKPLCQTFQQAGELIDLAQNKERRLMIDEVFLYRDGYKWLKEIISANSIKKINFSWQKYGSFKDTILNNLLYHDLYLLQGLLGLSELQINTISSQSERLELKGNYGSVEIKFNYNRLYEDPPIKKVEIVLDSKDTMVWHNQHIEKNGIKVFTESNNALHDMFQDILVEKHSVVYTQKRALQTLVILDKVKNKVD